MERRCFVLFVLFQLEQLEWEFPIRKWEIDGAGEVENDQMGEILEK